MPKAPLRAASSKQTWKERIFLASTDAWADVSAGHKQPAPVLFGLGGRVVKENLWITSCRTYHEKASRGHRDFEVRQRQRPDGTWITFVDGLGLYFHLEGRCVDAIKELKLRGRGPILKYLQTIARLQGKELP